jgi:hypothetical protein
MSQQLALDVTVPAATARAFGKSAVALTRA